MPATFFWQEPNMPRNDEELFRQIDDVVIWRVLKEYKFEGLLKERSVYFTRASILEDQYEGTFPKGAEFFLDKNALRPREWTEEDVLMIRQQQNGLRDFTFINCWYKGNKLPDMMWQTYLKDKDNDRDGKGVAVLSRVGQLFRSFGIEEGYTVLLGDVHYADYETEALPPQDAIRQFFMKTARYIDESELRAIIAKALPDTYALEDQPTGILVKCDLEVLIDEVWLPPNAPADYSQEIEALMRRYSFNKSVRLA